MEIFAVDAERVQRFAADNIQTHTDRAYIVDFEGPTARKFEDLLMNQEKWPQQLAVSDFELLHSNYQLLQWKGEGVGQKTIAIEILIFSKISYYVFYPQNSTWQIYHPLKLFPKIKKQM